ncbi:MAG: DUF4115 domain-containing protein [Gammaproteobacteria bacterium]|nr:DUF4115 domain-containing protein [Gammaproteobacteria bacterium]
MTRPGERQGDDPPATQSSGATLRAAREARKLTVEAVAQQIRLDPRVVELIEADRVGDLPAPTYARGYVRAYARHVGVDPLPLLATLGGMGAEPALRPTSAKPPKQAQSGDRPVKFVTYLLALALVVLPVLWWQARFADKDVTGTAAPPPVPPAPAPVDEPVGELRPSALGYAYRVVVNPDSPAPPPAPFEADATGTQAASVGADLLAVAPVADSEADAPPPAAGQGRLTLTTDADAWIEVSDAGGTRLYYNLARAGHRIEVEGSTPLRAVIGNSTHVGASFNGAPLDLRPYSNEGVARLRLDAGGASALP